MQITSEKLLNFPDGTLTLSKASLSYISISLYDLNGTNPYLTVLDFAL